MVAADGTVDWFCLPHYQGDVVFGALLDHALGGFWRLGPSARIFGSQTYREDTVTLVTSWIAADFELELVDTMAGPYQAGRERQVPRVLIRRLRCHRGRVVCSHRFHPRRNFQPVPSTQVGGASFAADDWTVQLWSSRPVEPTADERNATFELGANDEIWAALSLDGPGSGMSIARCAELVEQTEHSWRNWAAGLEVENPRPGVRRAAMLIHLLGSRKRVSEKVSGTFCDAKHAPHKRVTKVQVPFELRPLVTFLFTLCTMCYLRRARKKTKKILSGRL